MTEIEKDGKDNINENSNNKSSIGTEEATNTEANTEEIGGSKLRQHVNRFHKEGETAAHKEEMEEKNEQKTNEDDKKMETNTEKEEATNTKANTETIGVLGLQQEERERKGGMAAETKEATMEDKTEAGEADRQQEDKRDATDAQTEVEKLRARTYKSTKCGQGIVIEGWDDLDDYDVEDEYTMDDEELIKQRSAQSFQRRKAELNTIDDTEEDKNSTIRKEGKQDNHRLEKGEIMEDKRKLTETPVASDEENREEKEVDLQTRREDIYIDIETLQRQIDNCHDDQLEDLEKEMMELLIVQGELYSSEDDEYNGGAEGDNYYTMSDESRSSSENSEEDENKTNAQTIDYYRLLTSTITDQSMVLQGDQKIQVKFENKLLGMVVAKRNNKLYVHKINNEELGQVIQVNDIIRKVNSVRVGNQLAAIQSSVRPMYIEFVRKESVKGLDEKRVEYSTDEEWTDDEKIPVDTGINNSDIEGVRDEESMDSTERELQSVRDKERKKNDSEEDDDSDYQNNEEETDNDDESNDEDNPIEEEVEREGEEEEEEVEEEEENELMDTTGSNELCCAGDLCTHEFGQEIIGLSHRCRSCNGRLHGFLCSNEKSDELIGMVCKHVRLMRWNSESRLKEEMKNGKFNKEAKPNQKIRA